MNSNTQSKSKKIFLLFALLILGFLIFLGVMLIITLKPRELPSLHTKKISKASRGAIVSADGYRIATTQKLYKAVINTHYLDPNKKDLFVQLFSIYSGIDVKDILKKINAPNGVVILSYNIPEREAQYLKQLSYELNRLKVFIEIKNAQTGKLSVQGLNIIESGESREYPYGELLTPLIGYPHKDEENGYTHISGVKGLEKRFESELQSKQDEISQGLRDVNGYVILNRESFTKQGIDGLDVKLTIPVALQIKIEKMLSEMRVYLGAEQIMIVVMDATNGNILSSASSNRFLPKEIKKEDYPSLNTGIIEYSYEPGSVVKPITFALLLDKGLVNPYEMVNGFGGRYQIGHKTITDEHKFGRISAEDIIVHSSNVGIAQLSQRLGGAEFNQGLSSFGFAKPSTPDLIFEKIGSIPHPQQLENEIYRATCSYGYGMRANLLQLIKAYSAFNNDGKMITPRFVSALVDRQKKEILLPEEEQIEVIKSQTAQRMKSILVKTVNEGTGVKAITKGLEVGGKTGTAHIVEAGQYVKKYNTSFIGFANDKERKYTIGVGVIKPTRSQFASLTSVPVFKKIVDIMVEDGYLKPEVEDTNKSVPIIDEGELKD